MPDWLAVMVHVPAVTSVTVVPLTVQTGVVVEAKLTVRPELAVALTVTVPALIGVFGGPLNVIVCVCSTVKLCVTDVAAA